MKRFLALCILLCVSAASFAQGTITSGTASFARTTSSFDASPQANFSGVTTAGTDQLFEFGWWYRVSGDTSETAFPAPTTQSYIGDTSTITWTNVNGRGFDAQETCVVLGIASPVGGKVTCTMRIINTGASALGIDVFVMTDIDLGGSPGGDSVALGIPQQRLDISDATAVDTAQFAGVSANALLVRPFATTTDVAGLLSDTTITDFDNSGVPATNIDFTGGFQWTLSVPAGESRDAVTVIAFNTTALASADLSITKTDGVTSATPGGSVTYTITASNAGPSSVSGATVADTFPASLTCTWTCVGAGGGTCTGSGSGNINDTVNLPAGGSTTYTASCSISAAATGTLSNTATVAAPSGVTDPNPGNNSATDTDTLGPSADLSVTITDTPDPATAGGQISYAIGTANTGPSVAAAAVLSIAVPANTTFVSMSAPGGWSCTTPAVGGTGTVSCNLASYAAGGTANFTLVVVVSSAFAGGNVTATANISSTTGDANGANNSASATTAVNALTFVVTGAVAGSGGSIACASPVRSGTTTTCTVTPLPGYSIANISGCGGTTGATSPYTTGPIAAACTVTATFAAVAPQTIPTAGWPALVLLSLVLAALGLRRRRLG